MPNVQRLDVWEQTDLAFPYNITQNPLKPESRIVSGKNTLATFGGTLRTRPSTVLLSGAYALSNYRYDRILLYTTLDNPPHTYLIISAYNGTTSQWELLSMNLDDYPNQPPVGISDLRQCNNSTAVHQMVVSRGKVYVKSFPTAASGEKYGTVVLDGGGGTYSAPGVSPWGMPSPTEPVHMSNQFDVADPYYSAWTASAHPVTVNVGWKYTYAYESRDGTVSSRAPLETNPSMPSSNTGPFTNLQPLLRWKASQTLSQAPWLRIYRTMDGGGTFYLLNRIPNLVNSLPGLHEYRDNMRASYPVALANKSTAQTTLLAADTGVGTRVTTITVSADFATPETAPFLIKIEDEILIVVSKAGNIWTCWRSLFTSVVNHVLGTSVTDLGQLADPISDLDIDVSQVAPTLTSNSPPPTVDAPQITGSDTPAMSSNLVSFAGRIWYGIGNILYYSALEELTQGTPEGAFPSGTNGNFFRLPYPIVNLIATGDVLYVFTRQSTYWLRGNTRDSFTLQLLFADLGAAPFTQAVETFDRAVIWLTHDYRIAFFLPTLMGMIQRKFLTDQLGDDILAWIQAAGSPSQCDVQFCHFGNRDREWLMVNVVRHDDMSQTRQWVYDLKQNLWNTPWDMPVSGVVAGPVRTNNPTPKLIFGSWDVGNSEGVMTCASFSTSPTPGADVATFYDQLRLNNTNRDWEVQIQLLPNPRGNHVNELRAPGQATDYVGMKLDRVTVAGDIDPLVYVRYDDLTLGPIGAAGGQQLTNPVSPPRRPPSTGYKSYWYMQGASQAAERVSLRIGSFGRGNGVGTELVALGMIYQPESGA